MTNVRILNPNIEWEGRQTCAMNSEELLNVHKIIREKKDYHRSCFDSLLRRVIDIRRVLEAHPEGNNNFALRLLYVIEHARAYHALNIGTLQAKLAIIDAQLLDKDGPAGIPTFTPSESG